MTNKIPRSLETRSNVERPKSWSPPALLPDPDPEPGYAYRWIRIATLGDPDPTNISMKFREGWEAVKAEDHPELMMWSPTSGRFAGCVENGGLLLCKIPEEFAVQRDIYYANMNKSQMESVDNSFFKEFGSDATKPFSEKKTKVKFGRGTAD